MSRYATYWLPILKFHISSQFWGNVEENWNVKFMKYLYVLNNLLPNITFNTWLKNNRYLQHRLENEVMLASKHRLLSHYLNYMKQCDWPQQCHFWLAKRLIFQPVHWNDSLGVQLAIHDGERTQTKITWWQINLNIICFIPQTIKRWL